MFKRISQMSMIVMVLAFFAVSAYALTPDEKVLKSIQQRNLGQLKRLISGGYNVNARDIHKQTALEYGVRVDSYEIVKYLLESGADVNAQNKGGQTALMRAVHDNNYEITKLLLEHGADVNIETYERVDVFSVAFFRHASQEVRDLLDQAKKGEIGSFEEYMKAADELHDAGNIKKAHSTYLKAEKTIDSHNAEKDKVRLFASLSVTYFELNNKQQSKRYCEKVLELDPQNKWATAWLKKLK